MARLFRFGTVLVLTFLFPPAAEAWTIRESRIFGRYAMLAHPSGDTLFLVCDQSRYRLLFRFSERSPQTRTEAQPVAERRGRGDRRRGAQRQQQAQPPAVPPLRVILETERGYRFVRTTTAHQPHRAVPLAWLSQEALTPNDIEAIASTRSLLVSIEPTRRADFHNPQAVWRIGDALWAFQALTGRRGGCQMPNLDEVRQALAGE